MTAAVDNARKASAAAAAKRVCEAENRLLRISGEIVTAKQAAERLNIDVRWLLIRYRHRSRSWTALAA